MRRLLAPVVEAYALVRAALDDRTPTRVTAIVLAALAYAVLPVDLLPDVVPLVGWTDDVLVALLGRSSVIGLVPPDVMAEHRAAAREHAWLAAGVLAAALLLLVAAGLAIAWRLGWLP